MRYELTKEFKEYLKKNYTRILSKDKNLKWTLKNLIYKNKSIHQNQLEQISSILKFDQKQFNLNRIKFYKEKNFGEYLGKSEKINFKGIDKNFAEFIGILLGDGNIYRNNVRIMMDKREEQYKNYIKKLINTLFGIDFNEYWDKNSNQFRLYKGSIRLSDLLINHGLKRGNKIKNRVSIPDWIKRNKNFARFCLRGLIDTDGCVYKCKRDNKIYIKFTSASPILLKDVKNLTKKLDIHFVNSGKNNICLYRQKEIVKYINKIGFSNDKHLNKLGL